MFSDRQVRSYRTSAHSWTETNTQGSICRPQQFGVGTFCVLKLRRPLSFSYDLLSPFQIQSPLVCTRHSRWREDRGPESVSTSVANASDPRVHKFPGLSGSCLSQMIRRIVMAALQANYRCRASVVEQSPKRMLDCS